MKPVSTTKSAQSNHHVSTKEKTVKKKNAATTTKATTNATNENATQETTTMKATTPKTASTATKTTSTPATAAAAPPSAASAVDIPSQLQAIEQAAGYGDPLPDTDRRSSEKSISRVPSSIVNRVLALAARGNGTVAGITLDPDAASASLAQADDADAVATAASMLARRAQDEAIRLRAGVAGDVSAIRTALRGYVKTAQGASLAQANDELRTLAKQHAAAAKARNTKAKKAAEAAAGATPGATTATTPSPTPVPTPPTAAPKES